MAVKLKLMYKVTNKNIRLRYLKEKEKDESFSFSKMAVKFGMFNSEGDPDRALVSKWASIGNNKRLPRKNIQCPKCNKSLFEYVGDWINDGALNEKEKK